MEYVNVFYLIMVSVFTTYIAFIWLKFGIQPSISDSYYILPIKNKFLFTLYCWGIAFPAILVGTFLTGNVLMFLAGAGIGFVGAATDFKDSIAKNVHMVAAYGGVFFTQLSIAYDFHLYYVNAIFLVLALLAYILRNKIGNHIWWQEILAFLAIGYTMLLQIIN